MCTAPNCDSPVLAKGLCKTHYGRLRRTGSLDAPVRPTGCSICGKSVHGNGLCNTHYRRWQRFGDPSARGTRQRDSGPDETRWMQKVSVESPGCWMWQTGTNGLGYGCYSKNGRPVAAHRYVYELLVGPIPDDKELDHLCRRTLCVNPDHLEPVPHIVNVQRGAGPAVARLGRGRKVCMIDGCEKYRVGRGLCRTHYMRARRATDQEPEMA